MTYSTGNPALVLDYNTFAQGGASANHAVANVNSVWGIGYGDKGYGQTTALTPVVTGDTITASHWSTMILRINSCLAHQAGTTSGLTAPTSGQTIGTISNLSSKISTIYSNRFTYNSQGSTSTTTYNKNWASDTPDDFQQVRYITFTSGDKARYFFNAGGLISIHPSLYSKTIGGSGVTDKENKWEDFMDDVGPTIMGATSNTASTLGGWASLTTHNSGIGYHDLTATNQILTQFNFTRSGWSSNYVRVSARTNGPQGANGDVGNIVIFTIDYYDGVSDHGDENRIYSIFRITMAITSPETSNLTNSWGTITPS